MQVDHTKNIIEISHISFGYTDELVLKDVTFNIHSGDYLGVIGPNGGGKTTLLKIMLGLLTPRSGTVKLFGKDISEFSDWTKIGYVPQKAANVELFPATVEEVVAMGLFGKRGLFTWQKKEDTQAIQKALEQVGMWALRDRLIGDLSGGQQHRVFIARALVSQPLVIFLDEPTAGVDIKNQEEFYRLLERMNTSGITLVLVSHDIGVVKHEATELACINQVLVYHGDPKEFVNGEHLNDLYGKDAKFIHHDHTH